MAEEREITLEEANEDQSLITANQQKSGIAASDEEIAQAEETLRKDVERRKAAADAARARKETESKSSASVEEVPATPAATPPPVAPPAPTPEQEIIDEIEEEEEPERSPNEILAELGLKHEPKIRRVGSGDNVRTYTQRPLTFLGKIQFLSYIGEVLDQITSGPNALKLGSLFDVPTFRQDALSAEDFSDAQTFVQAIAKVTTHVPEFLHKCFCIWLQIPDYEREWAIAMLQLPEEEGGLSDDDGFDIIETFIDQNWDTLQDFFTNKVPRLRDRLSAQYKATQQESLKR